ncbi:hypothetical protein GUITHDRAFT_108809 [Guillardia theta CCMP2712]|uniref:PX domain-containing protein n=1 Tax=Guillardia theta (strain CCMP2712) TaxID=905079 RepID=L1JAN8_GUITC|nr:hypothetical protein GUITHDRAFT_108809 [Guillardia theta CCMP2712]EKX45164.1 hypothetical protein GUITHDRAFT_108809 [Guillardia theta CCMP2712]|eukprot:XP_005832144.1 hypothetical protein GUITHDRAFT_108809 [Guillardia theta CCMP2712]
MLDGILQAITPKSWARVDEEAIKQKREEWLSQIPTTDTVDGEEVEEKIIVFFEEAEEVRAEPELGGLGPGLTGEYTLYNFVVGRNEKRWKMKKRFSQFHAFDSLFTDYLKSLGVEESRLPEMSPSLVKARTAALQDYMKMLVEEKDFVREPMLRAFLKLPMTREEATAVEQAAVSGDGLLTGYGSYKSLFQRTREEKARGIHHTQKKELFAGPPTLAGVNEVGAAYAETSVHDQKGEKKFVIEIPLLRQLGLGARIKDIYGEDDIRGQHSTYGNKIKRQVEKQQKEAGKKDDFILAEPGV